MLINSRLSPVCIRNHFIHKFQMSGLRYILVDGRKQPERIVCTICRMPGLLYIRCIIRRIFMSRIVCKLYQWQSASIIHLCGKHKPDFFNCHLRCKVNDSLYILYRITITVSIAQSTVDKRRCTRPDKCHKAVIGVPCIYHGIEFFTRCLYLKMCKLSMPVIGQLLQFLSTDLLRQHIGGQNLCHLRFLFHSNQKCELTVLSRCKPHHRTECSAAVAVLISLVTQCSLCHTCRIAISVISSEELLSVAAPGCHFCSLQCKETADNDFIIDIAAFLDLIQIRMNHLPHMIPTENRARNKLRIL